MTASRFPWWEQLNTTTSTFGVPKEPIKVEDIEKVLEDLRGLPPANWILVAPDGRVWKGQDPMILAAKATYRDKEHLKAMWHG